MFRLIPYLIIIIVLFIVSFYLLGELYERED
jgi:hypothetical protein